MRVLLDTSEDLAVCSEELGVPVEQLITPLTRRRIQAPGQPFAIDNGAFARFNAKRFLALLRRNEGHRTHCRFVVVPDVVGSARRTLEVFRYWQPELCRWPLALACQDGQEELPIPWDLIDAVFIGGSTRWKESDAAAQCIKAAQALGKWVHVGRVNTQSRFEWCEQLGVDSVDGSGIAQFSWMRERIRNRNGHHKLFSQEQLVACVTG